LDFNDLICGLQSYNKYSALDLRTHIKQENMYHQMISVGMSMKKKAEIFLQSISLKKKTPTKLGACGLYDLGLFF